MLSCLDYIDVVAGPDWRCSLYELFSNSKVYLQDPSAVEDKCELLGHEVDFSAELRLE